LELKATKELKELEAIFNSSYDEIYVTDGEGYTLRVNKAGERFYGMKEAVALYFATALLSFGPILKY
jgi:PAS domain-containing protein